MQTRHRVDPKGPSADVVIPILVACAGLRFRFSRQVLKSASQVGDVVRDDGRGLLGGSAAAESILSPYRSRYSESEARPKSKCGGPEVQIFTL